MSPSFEFNILPAKDDKDDCLICKEASEEIEMHTQLITMHNGVQLMQLLIKISNESFAVLCPDLNMPRKTHFACLEEIQWSDQLNSLPVIISSVSSDRALSSKEHFLLKSLQAIRL